MKTEQLYKPTKIEEAVKLFKIDERYIAQMNDGCWSEFSGSFIFENRSSFKIVMVPFHPSPKEISEEEIKQRISDRMYENRFAECLWLDEKLLGELKDLFLSLPSSGSKTEAVSFTEWTNDLERCDYYPVYDGDTQALAYWEKRGKEEVKISTAELYDKYQLFLKDKQQ